MDVLAEIEQSEAGDHALDVQPPEAGREIAHQRQLGRCPCGEVGMTGLGRHRHEAVADAVQDGLAKPGPGRDQRRIARRRRGAGLQRVELVGCEHGHGVGHRLEVVQESQPRDARGRDDLPRAHPPRHVRERGLAVDDRAGDAQRHRGHARVERAERRLQQRRDAVVVERPKRADVERPRTRRAIVEESDQRLRSADVGREDHRRLL
jgi:hypothetical protein